uniref:Uncharacterized protein n=1 Tax=Romanomermis culicivorax TaxID=13658 RepID=A0A915K7F5_ROMCU
MQSMEMHVSALHFDVAVWEPASSALGRLGAGVGFFGVKLLFSPLRFRRLTISSEKLYKTLSLLIKLFYCILHACGKAVQSGEHTIEIDFVISSKAAFAETTTYFDRFKMIGYKFSAKP